MKKGFSIAWLIFAALLVTSIPARSQQSDTSTTIRHLDQADNVIQEVNRDRSVGNMYMSETGRFDVPEPQQWYQPPFKAQEYLNRAVEALNKKWNKDYSLLYRIINTIAPFINNQFQFAVYQIYDLPMPDRDNPLRYPQLNAKKARSEKQEAKSEK